MHKYVQCPKLQKKSILLKLIVDPDKGSDILLQSLPCSAVSRTRSIPLQGPEAASVFYDHSTRQYGRYCPETTE